MNEPDAIIFFRSQTIALARALPLADAVSFLHGGLAIAGEHEAMASLREVYQRLHSAVSRLEEIQLPPNPGPPHATPFTAIPPVTRHPVTQPSL